MQVMVADVGNSSIKLMRASLDCKHRSIVPLWTHCLTMGPDVNEDGELKDWVPEESSSPALPWYVSSVSKPNEEALRHSATRSGMIKSWNPVLYEHIELELDVERPAATGIDRLLAAQAALHLYGEGRDVIVIDCGTAMTIDVVTRNGVFRGGVILAGPKTSLKALGLMTDALPDLSHDSLEAPSGFIGRSTRDALLCGAWLAGLGAIREVVSRFQKELGNGAVVVGTGGGLGPWRQELPESWLIVNNLVIDGLFEVAVERFCERP